MPSWCHSLEDRALSFVCSDSTVPLLPSCRLQTRDRDVPSLAVAILENSCWCVQMFEIPLRYKHATVWNKGAAVHVQYSKVTATREEVQATAGIPDSCSLPL